MKQILMALAFVCGGNLLADDAKPVPPVMYEFMGSFFRLQPYMFSSKKFQTKEAEKLIGENLVNLKTLSRRLPHNSRLSTSAFQISAEALQKHLDETSAAFSSGRKEYARRMLVATIDGCSSCHAQVPGRNLPQWTFRADEVKGSAFEKAEFFFTVRHYPEAIQAYKSFVHTATQNRTDTDSVEVALRRQLVIVVRVLRDYKMGIELFGATKNLPINLQRDVTGWVEGLKDLLKNPPPDATQSSLKSVEAYAERMIDPLLRAKGARFEARSFVGFLAASGLIFDFINNRPSTDLSPKLLRLLAQCDAQISHGYFFSLTDNYLRECIVRFPQSPEAQKCFEDLETSLTISYSGSAGTNIPKEIKDELDALRGLLPKTPVAK